jgi:hypothetical protein
MRVVDPVRYFGIDSGVRELQVSKAERATLLRAVAILERGHDLLIAVAGEDHQGEYEDANEALCLGPVAIRRLAEAGLALA